MNYEDKQRNQDIEFVRADFNCWIRFTDNFVATLTKTRRYLNAHLWELEVRGKKEAIPRNLGGFILREHIDDGVYELRKLLKNQCEILEFDNMDSLILESTVQLNRLGYW